MKSCYSDADCGTSGACTIFGTAPGVCDPAATPKALTLSAGQEVFLSMYANPVIGTMYNNEGRITVTYKTVGAGNAVLQRRSYWVYGSPLGSATSFTLPASTAGFSTITLGADPNSRWIGAGAATLKVKNTGSNTIQITSLTVYGGIPLQVMGTYPQAKCGTGPACTEGNICYQNACKKGCGTSLDCPTGYSCKDVACMPDPPCVDTDPENSIYKYGTVSGGTNNTCSGGVCQDSCYDGRSAFAIWNAYAVFEWGCENNQPKNFGAVNCPSGVCKDGACTPGICTPGLDSPGNGEKVNVASPVMRWNQCYGAKYSQINVTGEGIDQYLITGENSRTYTLTGLGFKKGKEYRWRVRACIDKDCKQAGPWSEWRSWGYDFTCTPPPTDLCAPSTGISRKPPWLDSYCDCPTCVKENGDADCKDGVTIADYEIWKCEFLKVGACATTTTADFNKDGKVNLVDFEILRSTLWGSGATGTD